MKNFKDFIEKETEHQKYLFIRGFLLTDQEDVDTSGFPFFGNWHKTQLTEKYVAYTHYLQNVYKYKKNETTFFLIGHAYNPFTMEYKEEAILRYISEKYGTEEYQNAVDELTGLFLFGTICGDNVNFITDPSGMQSSYYCKSDKHFYISSHAQLIGDLCDFQMSETAKEFTAYKWYYRVMGPYMPADLTQFDEVKRIVPNAQYRLKDGSVSHYRMYPLKEIQECKTTDDYQQIIEKAAQILKNNMILVSKKWKHPSISLSGGIDSNTAFAAANGLYNQIKSFSFISAEKEVPDADAAKIIAEKFNVDWKLYPIPENNSDLPNLSTVKRIIDHNNGYIARGRENEYRKRAYLIENLETDVEIKSWVSEIIRAYWYKHYGRKRLPKLSPKLFRNLYKIFIFNRSLAHKTDKIFKKYIEEFDYKSIPSQYPPADMHMWEVTMGSWGGPNISEMKIYADIVIIYNNRKLLDTLFKVPLEKRINDEHHLDIKKILNNDLYDMNIRIVNMTETPMRAFLLNTIFTINSTLPF